MLQKIDEEIARLEKCLMHLKLARACYLPNPIVKEMNHREMIALILSTNGLPMRAPDIAKRMLQLGCKTTLTQTELSNSVFTNLGRCKLFVKVGKGMWALKSAQQQLEGNPCQPPMAD
jgi:hypothetical protein